MSRLARLAKIMLVFMRHRLDLLLEKPRLAWWARALLLPARMFNTEGIERGERLRAALEELGPVFIKFGQMLSTRPDVIPRDLAASLSKLQDEVTPIDDALAREIIEQALGASVADLFQRFDPEVFAAASIAQVHTAQLHSGEEVIVKLVRPDIEQLIHKDLKLMHMLAGLTQKHISDAHRLRPAEVVREYEHIVLSELNMQLEAANAARLRSFWQKSTIQYVPEVYWDYVRPNVLVMERIHGIPVSNIEDLRSKGTDFKLLAERGVEIFFTQVFRDNFFHADMHPGNIFVDASKPEDPGYICVDCAIIGTLDEKDQYYLARNLLAVFQRDYRTVAELHIESGWVPEHVRAAEFESAIRSVCEPIFEKPLAEISFGQILLYLFTVARRFEMTVQPNLVLLQKTLLNVEGLGRQLYPQLDLWNTAQPFLERWMEERYLPSKMMQKLSKQAPKLLEQLPLLPELLTENIKASARVTDQSSELSQLRAELSRRLRRQRIVAGFLLLLGCFLLLVPDSGPLAHINFDTPAVLLGGIGLFLFLIG